MIMITAVVILCMAYLPRLLQKATPRKGRTKANKQKLQKGTRKRICRAESTHCLFSRSTSSLSSHHTSHHCLVTRLCSSLTLLGSLLEGLSSSVVIPFIYRRSRYLPFAASSVDFPSLSVAYSSSSPVPLPRSLWTYELLDSIQVHPPSPRPFGQASKSF